MKVNISKNLIELAEIFQPSATLYIVGGFIRNALLGIKSEDIDICSALTPNKIEKLLENTKYKIVKKFESLGAVIIKCEDEVYEHTTFRRDNYENSGVHKPKSVDYIENLRLDAQRRDFTINSIYYNILEKKLIDIYSGKLDLKNGVIRSIEVPAYVFSHDGLRILRMIRFACELNFKIDNTTLLAAKHLGGKVNDISNKRKFVELIKILNSPNKYPISKRNANIKGLTYFNNLKLWPSYGVLTSKVKINMCKKVSVENSFYALLIDIIDTINPDCIEYYIKDLLGKNGFNLPNTEIEKTNFIICGYYDALNKMSNKKYFFKYFDHFEQIGQLLQIKNNKLYGKYKFFHNYITKHQLPIDIKSLKINGDDLKNFPTLPPKKYGVVLCNLLSKVFDGQVANEKEELLKEVENDITNDNY